jgi:Transport and Golgi organisation 2
MCTVSVIRLADQTLRIACNRDEQRTRPPSLPPEVRLTGNRRSVMPMDPQSGGTWIGANDAGLVLAILNRTDNPNPQAPRTAQTVSGTRSRGELIPLLLAAGSAAELVQLAVMLPSNIYAGFRLIAIDAHSVAEVTCADGEISSTPPTPLPRDGRLLFTSSGLGDLLVAEPRRVLFEGMVTPLAEAQDRFHRHSWPEANHLSVCMSRADARTVSYTVMELGPDAVKCHHHAGPPDAPADRHSLTLPLQAVTA